jgi:hypothetical protein
VTTGSGILRDPGRPVTTGSGILRDPDRPVTTGSGTLRRPDRPVTTGSGTLRHRRDRMVPLRAGMRRRCPAVGYRRDAIAAR